LVWVRTQLVNQVRGAGMGEHLLTVHKYWSGHRGLARMQQEVRTLRTL